MTTKFAAVNIYARIASVYHFMLEGTLMGIWATYLPSIQETHNINDSSLGFAVLLMYLGTVLATQLAALLLRNFGSRTATFVGAVCFSLFLPLIALAPNYESLCVFMFMYGYAMGVLDVSMNGIAVLTEMVAERPLLNSVHGTYSLAAGIATMLAGVLSSTGWGALPVFSVASGITLICSCSAYFGSYSHEDEKTITDCHNNAHFSLDNVVADSVENNEVDKPNHEEDGTKSSGLLNAVFLYFAAIGFLASFGEVSMTTWSIIYFERYLKVGTLKASIGFGTFMVCMALGRFAGDSLREMYGRQLLIRACGMCLVIGFAVFIYSPSIEEQATGLYIAYFGSLLIGFGLSILIPVVFSSAGHLPGVHAGTAIAAAAAFTYTGSITAPLFLGLCSQLIGSLLDSFIIDGALMSGIFVLSFLIPGEISQWFGTSGDESEPLL